MREAEPVDYPDMLRVIEYNPNEDNIYHALGITDERWEELKEKAIKVWKEADNSVIGFVKMSKLAENANELVVMTRFISMAQARSRERADQVAKSA